MITRITQSFIKTMREYMAGDECGNIVKKMFIDEENIDYGSEKMAEGSYFEFLVSGSMGKAGIPPQPEWLASGLKKAITKRTVNDMTMPYKRATINAERVKAIMVEMGLEFFKINHKMTKGRFQGDIDLIVTCTKDITLGGIAFKAGDRLVIDLKYSGLLNDRWNKHGWQWSDLQKEYHGTQAIQYAFISGLPFFFWVISSTNLEKENEDGVKEFQPTDMKVFHVKISKDMEERHLAEGNKLMENLLTYSEIGLVPRPSFSKCRDCPLLRDCTDRHSYPHGEIVEL